MSGNITSDDKKKTCSLRVLGYELPWWVLVLVLLAVLYLLYDYNVVNKFVGQPTHSLPRMPELPSLGSLTGGVGVETPEEIRNLFRI